MGKKNYIEEVDLFIQKISLFANIIFAYNMEESFESVEQKYLTPGNSSKVKLDIFGNDFIVNFRIFALRNEEACYCDLESRISHAKEQLKQTLIEIENNPRTLIRLNSKIFLLPFNFHSIKFFKNFFKSIVKKEIENSLTQDRTTIKFNTNLRRIINIGDNIFIRSLIDEAFREIAENTDMKDVVFIDASFDNKTYPATTRPLIFFPDVSKFQNLSRLDCSNNSLSELHCTNIKEIDCHNNEIRILYCPNVVTVNCSNNNLKKIFLPGAIRVICFDNALEQLYCPNAITLKYSYNLSIDLFCPRAVDVECSKSWLDRLHEKDQAVEARNDLIIENFFLIDPSILQSEMVIINPVSSKDKKRELPKNHAEEENKKRLKNSEIEKFISI